nr:retrovirus-related Pol polyprotein from transposon TNT 1-94 [Tanacetum cinerariifolium]
MTIETHNWSSSAQQELHKIVRDEIFPIVNQVDARLQNFKIQFLKEAAKFVGDFKSLANEADASLAKHKALELEIERLLKAVVSQDIMIIVQNESVVNTSDFQTELERTKRDECKYDKISYDKAYKDMQQKIKRLQAQLGDLKGKSKDTSCVSDTQNPLSQKLENENVKLEFQDTSKNTKFAKQPSVENLPKVGETNALSKPVTSNSVSTPQESKGVDNTKTRRPQPRSNTKHDRDVISKVFCAMCNKCLISVNHDKCLRNYVNGKNSHGKKQKAKVSFKENQMKYQPKVAKPKKVESHKSLATPKPRKSRLLLRWLPTGRLFNQEGKIVDSSESDSQSDCVNVDNAGNLKLLINFVWKFMGTVRFKNDHVAAILGFGDLQWGNILITRVYFVEGLGHNLFSVGQFCNSDLEIAFRGNACFVRNLEGVDLLKEDRSTNLYTINLYEMASASPICLMARASSTKSWLWHQQLSHLNFDTINDLARNDLVAGLPKFKYH